MVVNHTPLWKGLLITFILLLGLLYALPNLYGDDPALQVLALRGGSVDTNLQKKISNSLNAAAMTVKSIELNKRDILIRFTKSDEQLKAKTLLSKQLGERYVVALNKAPATPAWLDFFGAKPMKLGLDLSGGIRLLLAVDINTAIDHRLDGMISDLRAQFRKERLRYRSIRVQKPHLIIVRFKNAEDRDAGARILRSTPDFANLQVLKNQSENANFDIRVALTPEAVRRITQTTLEQSMSILRNRVNELGVAEAVVQRQGSERIAIELPGVQDSARAKDILGKTATLQFMLLDEEHDVHSVVAGGPMPAGDALYHGTNGEPYLLKKRIILTGESIISAQSNFDEYGRPEVQISLDGNSSRFTKTTRENVGKRMATLYIETRYDEVEKNGETVKEKRVVREVISAPRIQSALGSNFRITGLDDPAEARNLALLLRAGALPVPIDIIEERAIGPSLGAENIKMGVQSVVLGLVLVLVAMALYYSVFGLLANIALMLNLVLLLAVLSLISATLTLPGIAGIVLTLGMAVDANVLIFERIREELRHGTSVQASIQAGYEKAFITIVDAQVTTLIAALVLFTIGSGPIKGFAITLSIGLLTSMFTAVTVSRAMVNTIFGGRNLKKIPLGGH